MTRLLKKKKKQCLIWHRFVLGFPIYEREDIKVGVKKFVCTYCSNEWE